MVTSRKAKLSEEDKHTYVWMFTCKCVQVPYKVKGNTLTDFRAQFSHETIQVPVVCFSSLTHVSLAFFPSLILPFCYYWNDHLSLIICSESPLSHFSCIIFPYRSSLLCFLETPTYACHGRVCDIIVLGFRCKRKKIKLETVI